MTKTPSDQTLESLSALVDGATTEFETRRLLDMADNTELTAKWQRYHLAGALMRKELSQPADGQVGFVDLSARISAAIAKEASLEIAQASVATLNPVPVAEQSAAPVGRVWADWLAKSAIAASIAAAVVFGVQFTQQGDNAANMVADAGTQEPVVAAPVGFDVPSPEARNVSLGRLAEPERRLQSVNHADQTVFVNNAAVEAELQQLFLEHAELSAQNGKFGLMPMARAAKMQTAE